jgi:hypothetical protein
MYLKVLGCENIDWIHMDENVVQLHDLTFMVITIWSLNMAGISWLTHDRQFPRKVSPLKWVYDEIFFQVLTNLGVETLTWVYWDLLRVAFSAFFILEMALTDPKRILAVTWTRLCVDDPPVAPVYPEDRPCPWLTPPPKLCPWAYEQLLLLLLASLARQDLQPSGILPTLQ